MALTVTFNRTLNKVKLDDSDSSTGKLQIQFNGSDIYNNLSGSTNDVSSGAGTYIPIPLNSDGGIPKGEYYFNYVDNGATYSGTVTVNFQVDDITGIIGSEVDIYSPSLRVSDSTSYTVANATVSSASRTLTLQYPAGSSQATLSSTASDLTTSLYVSTKNVWTGAHQATLDWSATMSIAATTGYSGFTYISNGSQYKAVNIECTTDLASLYGALENFRSKLYTSSLQRRTDYNIIRSDYTLAMSLVAQYREAVSVGQTSACSSIIVSISSLLNANGITVECEQNNPRKIYGVNSSYANEGTINGSLDISAADAALLNSAGKTLIQVPSGYVAQIHSAAIIQTDTITSGTVGQMTFEISTSGSATRLISSLTKASESNAVRQYYQFDLSPSAGSRVAGDDVVLSTTADVPTAAYSTWRVIFNYTLIEI